MRSVDKQQVLRWVEELKEKQTKPTAREEARKEEILQVLEGCWVGRQVLAGSYAQPSSPSKHRAALLPVLQRFSEDVPEFVWAGLSRGDRQLALLF